MSAIMRQSRHVPSIKNDPYAQAASPVVIPHAAFVGIGLSFSNGAAVTTVAVDSILTGDFAETVTLEGTGKHRWPNADGMNRLYNAAYVKITWNVGTLRVFQKG